MDDFPIRIKKPLSDIFYAKCKNKVMGNTLFLEIISDKFKLIAKYERKLRDQFYLVLNNFIQLSIN